MPVAVVAVVCWLLSVPAALASPAPPPNDNYLSSTIIPQSEKTGSRSLSFGETQDTTAATTQSDLFNPDANGFALGGGGQEPLSCSGAASGNTIWYDLHPTIPEGVEVQASGFATSISVYRYDTKSSLLLRGSDLCQTSTSSLNDFPVPGELRSGRRYTVQIGGLQTAPSSFASGQLAVRFTFFPDHDGDGVYDALDACPNLPGVQRFSGCPPTIHAIPRYGFTGNPGGGVRLQSLEVDQIPGGARVEARCRACGRSEVRHAGRRARSVLMNGLDGLAIPDGAKLEIFVTKRASGNGLYRHGAIGSYISYTITGQGVGARVLRCLMPGSLHPQRSCPAKRHK